ncbi:DNA-3-methyladenine glycosylase [Actinidia chinensis var. chinensis]|uniref:DNA-3-methyladenine glycosylase n=1 Tax=Actinidia chinensis var. chinensis TaxID=1590841 RepID=A0A2R6RMS6_ACTCC|nr:DNA-3-methyladenine glycosylase [Actinidia chinensis var. chinensis]
MKLESSLFQAIRIPLLTLKHLRHHSATDISPLNSPLMGESTQAQAQAQIPTEPTQPHPDPAATATATATANAPPQNRSPTAKIPLRPRKIRKLSPDDDDADSKSPHAAAEKPKSTPPKAAKNKIVPFQPKPAPKIAARSLSCDGEIEIALRHLRAADPLLAPLIDMHLPPNFVSFHPPFLALTKSILYQQLAYKAGTSIYTSFVSLCGGEACVLPDTVLALTPQQLRQIGVSGRKASYLHDLARKYQNGILSDSSIVEMDDKSLFTMLTMVNGIGSWSVHMFMVFSLHRPDVLPVNDLGVRKGVQMLYGLEDLPRPSQMEQLCEKWRPYRSVASWYMWRFVEAKGAPSSAGAVVGGPSLQLQLPEQQQQQQQPQFLDSINGILNLGACAWGQ